MSASAVRTAVCEACGHPMTFHLDLKGYPRPCDHEAITPYGLGEMPSLCGCSGFKADGPVAQADGCGQ